MNKIPEILKSLSRPPLVGSGYLRALSVGLAITAANVGAATLTWDSDTSVAGIQEGNGTWTASSNNFWNGTANAIPAKGTDNINIGSSGGGFTVTIDNGGAFLNYSDATSNSSLFFGQSYTLAGTVAGDGISAGNVTVAAGKTAIISAGLNDGTSAGQKTWSVGDGSTLTLSGGGDIQNLSGPTTGTAGTINFTGGTWTNPGSQFGANGSMLNINQSGATFTFASGFQTGTNLTTATAAVTYTMSGGSMTLSSGGFSVGSGTTGATGIGTGTFNLSGGTVVLNGSGSKVVVGGGGNGTTGGANGALNISAGSFTTSATSNSKFFLGTNESTLGATSSAVNISGGTVKVNGIQFGDNGAARTFTAGSTAALNLTGGTLNIGSDGIGINGTQANLTRSINLGGGTVGFYVGAGSGTGFTSSSAVTITLTGINGKTTFRASDENGVAKNITLDSAVVGVGGMIKTDGGTLAFTNAGNTFSGGFTLNAGIASTSGTSGVAFGAGDIAVNGGTLQLGNFNSISNTGSITIGSGATIALNFGSAGTEVVGSIYYSPTGLQIPIGTYNYSQLNALIGATVFTSSGNSLNNLVSVTAVPEPATWSLIGVGFCFTLIAVRRFRNQAHA
jgi:hypothetical protein